MVRNKVLVIIDMQNDFTTGTLGNKECKAVIPKIVDYINTHGSEYNQIILTRDTHFNTYLSTQEGRKLPVAHCIKDTDGWKIVKEIEDAVSHSNIPNIIINKNTFGSIELVDHVKSHINTDYTFVGVCTGICVISNVLIAKAANPEAELSVISDLCACVTPESHKTALDAMKMCQVNIIE